MRYNNASPFIQPNALPLHNLKPWLAEKGYVVTAVDISAEMMERAKKKISELGLQVKWCRDDIAKIMIT